jgi:glycosyltransferase involved in cell wall biosynthesis
MSTELPLISVVVTTKNEEKHIGNCLTSIVAQDYPRDRIEVIVVDNQSDDRTKEISLQFTDKVFDKGPERNTQRNMGLLELATGEYKVWIDADMILSPSLLSACVTTIQKSGDVALNVSEVVLGQGFWSKVRRFERSFYDNTVIDGCRFICAGPLKQSGGFAKEWTHGPDDWDLDKKLKQYGSIGFVDVPQNPDSWGEIKDYIKQRGVDPDDFGISIYHDESDFDMRYYLGKKRYYIANFQKYIDRWGADDPDVKKQLGLWYRYFVVFVENGKWTKILRHPVLFLGMWLLRGLVGIVYLSYRP